VEGILGLRPTMDGIRICPAVPAEWDGFTMVKKFRGTVLNIKVDNAAHKEGKPSKVLLNGVEMADGFIPASALTDNNDIVVVM